MRKLNDKFVIIGLEFSEDIPNNKIIDKTIDFIEKIFKNKKYRIFDCDKFKSNNTLYSSIWQYTNRQKKHLNEIYYLFFINIKIIDIFFNQACVLQSFQEVEYIEDNEDNEDNENNSSHLIKNEEIINKEYYFFDENIFQSYWNLDHQFTYKVNHLFVFYNEEIAKQSINSKSNIYQYMLHKLPLIIKSEKFYLYDYKQCEQVMQIFFNQINDNLHSTND